MAKMQHALHAPHKRRTAYTAISVECTQCTKHTMHVMKRMIAKATPTQHLGFASISDKLPTPHVAGLGHDSHF